MLFLEQEGLDNHPRVIGKSNFIFHFLELNEI